MRSFSLLCSALLLITNGLFAQTPNFQWAKVVPSSTGGSLTISDIATDVAGNVFTTGVFTGTHDFDPGSGLTTLSSLPSGFTNLFISKFDPQGNLIWAKSIGGDGHDNARKIVVDFQGNVLVTGTFQDTVDFDPGAGIANQYSQGYFNQSFTLKLDGNGNFLWVKTVGMILGNDEGRDLAVDNAGNVYTAGHFVGAAIDFDPGMAVFPLGTGSGKKIFVQKLDVNGAFVWAKQFEGVNTNQLNSIAVDAAQNVSIGGQFNNSLDIDPGLAQNFLTNTNCGTIGCCDSDGFVIRLNSSGNLVWGKQFGACKEDGVTDMAVDPSGNLYIVGVDNHCLAATPHGTCTSLLKKAFVRKLNSFGNTVWNKELVNGVTPETTISGITLDQGANPIVVGRFKFSTNLGNGVVSSSSILPEAFVVKYDPTGLYQWSQILASPRSDYAVSTASSPNGLYVSGQVYDTLDFDPGPGLVRLGGPANQWTQFLMKIGDPCVPISSTTNQNACGSFSLPGSSNSYTQSGTYIDTLSNASGCDSVVTLNLTIANCPAINPVWCGTTLSSMNTYLSYSSVAGATNYRYRLTTSGNSIVHIRGYAAANFSFAQISGLLYNTTYDVEVAAFVGGSWGSYGQICSITTPANTPSTQLLPGSCNVTVSTLSDWLFCASVPGATNFRYEVTGTGGFNQVYTRGWNSTAFRIGFVSGISYNATYSVRVAAEVNGVWGSYGASCSITTPALTASSQLHPNFCNITVPSWQSYIYYTSVPGATAYRLELTAPGFNTVAVRNTSNPIIRFDWIPGLNISTIYNVRVAAFVGGTWGSYGSVCTLTSPATLRLGFFNETVEHDSVDLSPYPGDIQLFPNPNSGQFTLDLGEVNTATLTVYSALGQLILNQTISQKQSIVNLGAVSPGVYLMKVQAGDKAAYKRIVVR